MEPPDEGIAGPLEGSLGAALSSYERRRRAGGCRDAALEAGRASVSGKWGAKAELQSGRPATGFDELRMLDDALFWIESRPQAGGGGTLVRWTPADGTSDMTPAGFDVTSDVHAYGGGVYAVIPGGVWCVRDGSAVRPVQGPGAPSTADLVTADRGVAYGDLTAAGGELLCVREAIDGSEEGDSLLAIPIGVSSPRVLVREPAGFLASPRAVPGWLAWLRWPGEQMPWDATELVVARYEPGGPVGEGVVVAGGPRESVLEPRWGPDGHLYFVSDRTGWRNLYRWDGSQVRPVAPMAAECAAEPWELGYSSYAFLADGRIAMAVQQGPRHCLAVVEVGGGGVRRVELPFTSLKPYVAAGRDSVAVIASSPVTEQQVVVIPLGSPGPVKVVARAGGPQPDGLAVSVPDELEVASEGRRVNVLVYPPVGVQGGWQAPLVVRAHPGPNASSMLRFDREVQFFTSRGFAVVDVDYAGSTGYGRAFRQALYGRWGVDDVADCRAVAEHLVGIGRAVLGQVFIRGASAGGYTALKAVSGDSPFAAAAAVSAIVDPDAWAWRAPRFQRAHAARLRGSAGAVRPADIDRPVLLVHGTGDPVAPVEEVEALAGGLSRRDLLYDLVIVDRGGHEVSRSGKAEVALEAELALYRSLLGS